MDIIMRCNLNDLIQYYAGMIIILVIYGALLSYFPLPVIGIYLIWIAFVFILVIASSENIIDFLGINIDRETISLFITGLLMALSIQSIIVIIMYFCGIVSSIYIVFASNRMGSLFGGLFVSFIVAFSEELVFRGYPIRKMHNCIKEVWILVITGLVFSIMHASNPGYNLNAFIFLFLANILLGKLIIDSQSLWGSISFHFAWNFTEGYVFGLPISGTTSNAAIFRIILKGNSLISGGTFGIEASLISIIILAITILLYIEAKHVFNSLYYK